MKVCGKTAEEMALCKTQCEQEVNQAKVQLELEQQEKLLLRAQLDGLRNQYGLISSAEDFSSKEKFVELDQELIALDKLLKNNWPEAKRKIRNRILKNKD